MILEQENRKLSMKKFFPKTQKITSFKKQNPHCSIFQIQKSLIIFIKKITEAQNKWTRKVPPLLTFFVKGIPKSISTSYGITQKYVKQNILLKQKMDRKMRERVTCLKWIRKVLLRIVKDYEKVIELALMIHFVVYVYLIRMAQVKTKEANNARNEKYVYIA